MTNVPKTHEEALKVLAGRSVMIVDDQAFIRRLVARALADVENLMLLDAEDGGAAIRQIKFQPVDAVLMDINMKPVNGLEALKRLRTGSAGPPAIPVIMLTTVADERAVKTAMRLDANGFIVKPASAAILVSRLARGLTVPTPLKSIREYKDIEIPDIGELVADQADADAVRPAKDTTKHTARPGYEIRSLPIQDVAAGDRLVESVRTAKGVDLLPEETVLTPQLATSLRDLSEFVQVPEVTVEREVG